MFNAQRDWESAGLDLPLSFQSPGQDQNAPSALLLQKWAYNSIGRAVPEGRS